MEIRAEGLTKTYGDVTALSGFTAVFPAGAVSCIMAPSGAGKTTLLRILMGLETPDSGSVSGLEGARLGAVFQEDRLCENLSAVSNIRLVRPSLGKAEIEEALAAVGLGAEALGRPVREFSGGMKRRVSLLRALLSDADVLLLDEPLKGLDAETKQVAARALRECGHGRTVILVTHDEAEAAAVGAVQIIQL
ncbi:MAG: ATP-binding cassette domain-containing protein [Clostridiales Family XIII bacterium]|nr:ATP-binding cassette domain-containing protein [Clostridiales Family XIII bacterium]